MLLKSVARFFANKLQASSKQAVSKIQDGARISVGGYGACGVPENLLNALVEQGTKNLTVYSITAGLEGHGIGNLIKNGQVKRLVTSDVSCNEEVEKLWKKGKLELELIPQGIMMSKFRGGGAGIPGFFTKAGVGTYYHFGGLTIKCDKDGKAEILSPPKESRKFGDQLYLQLNSVFMDFALIKAQTADNLGNCIYRYTAMNNNPDIATAAEWTICEAEEIVKPGDLNPEKVGTQAVYVHSVVKGETSSKQMKKDIISKADFIKQEHLQRCAKIAKRATEELKDGMVVSLGMGIPSLIPEFTNKAIVFTTTTGVLGAGHFPEKNQEDPDIIGATFEPITLAKGSAVVSQAQAFDILRGGHTDVVILGALQVSVEGDIANWYSPGEKLYGFQSNLDLVNAAGKKIVVMHHVNSQGQPKIVDFLTYNKSASKCVDMIITDLGVFKFINQELILTEIFEGVTIEQIKKCTTAPFRVSTGIQIIR